MSEPSFIPLIIPEIRGQEWTYVKDCLDTGWVSSVGAYVDRFEQAVAERVQQKHAVATVNGTSALHIALQLLGVEADDEVLVSTLTFIAPVNAIRYLGAWPVFIDAEPDYLQMDHHAVAAFLATCEQRDGGLFNPNTGRRVRAIMPVHVLGHPVDLMPLIEIARRYALPVLEDASEALGTMYRGQPVGNQGDIACFSFNGNKLITCGGGGMLVTSNEEWAKQAKHLTTQAKCDPIEYEHDFVGYNYRLTNVAAAIGLAQLEQLDDYVAIKRGIAARYAEAFSTLEGIQVYPEAEWAESTFWMYTVGIDEAQFGRSSREVLQALGNEKIQTRPLWMPAHQNPPYREIGAQAPVAESAYQRCLSLPCSVGLTEADQARVIKTLQNLAK